MNRSTKLSRKRKENDKLMKQKEKELDKKLKDTFPASDSIAEY